MATRRDFLNFVTRILLWAIAVSQAGWIKGASVFAQLKKRILPKGTDPAGLAKENPAYLDTRHLRIMALDAFKTMGDEDAPFNPNTWTLTVTGAVRTPLELNYVKILNMRSIERSVLLVCPGVFSNHGRWEGISITEIMKRVEPLAQVTKAFFYGHSETGERKETFTIAEVKNDKVFLAYGVNGRLLPRKHGFPLRVVAEGHWGSHWLKYVYKVEFA